MLLGVVLHSAQVYNPQRAWVLHSDKTDPLMGYLVEVIFTFRMPAFFVVSGYFCYLTLSKYKVKKFLKIRLSRIVVPLVFVLLTLNLLQSIFLEYIGARPPLSEYIQSGGYVAHLWFLINLVVYFLVASVVALVITPFATTITKATEFVFSKIPMLIFIFLLPLLSIFITGLLAVGFPLYANYGGFFSVFIIMSYTPFFVFGAAIAIHKDTLQKFSSINPFISLAIAVAAGIAVKMLQNTQGMMTEIGTLYLNALSQWASVLVCFYVFFQFFNKQSKISRLLSESSYSVYLLHHVFVIMLAALFIHLGVPAIPGTVMLIIIVSAIALLIHTRVIAKNKLLLYFFNGK